MPGNRTPPLCANFRRATASEHEPKAASYTEIPSIPASGTHGIYSIVALHAARCLPPISAALLESGPSSSLSLKPPRTDLLEPFFTPIASPRLTRRSLCFFKLLDLSTHNPLSQISSRALALSSVLQLNTFNTHIAYSVIFGPPARSDPFSTPRPLPPPHVRSTRQQRQRSSCSFRNRKTRRHQVSRPQSNRADIKCSRCSKSSTRTTSSSPTPASQRLHV